MNYLDIFYLNKEYYMDYPSEISIETTGKCNSKCKFCPHDELVRKNVYMQDELFMKIINDLKEIPNHIRYNISPFKVNEPLMDPNFFKRVEMINRELPNVGVRFFSNFNMANEDTVKKIGKIKNLSSIYISVNSLDVDEYKDVMSLSLNKTIKNIKILLEYNKKYKYVDKISLGRVGDGTFRDRRFIDSASELFKEWNSEFEIQVLKRVEWIDHIENRDDKPIELPCNRWFELSITCTGAVSLCCMDGKCQFSIGDVNNQSVLEVYNDYKYKQLRLKCPKRKYFYPCKVCSAM